MRDLRVRGYTQVVRGELWVHRPTSEMRDPGTNKPKWWQKVRSKETWQNLEWEGILKWSKDSFQCIDLLLRWEFLEQIDLGDERVFGAKKPTNEVSSRDETTVRSEST